MSFDTALKFNPISKDKLRHSIFFLYYAQVNRLQYYMLSKAILLLRLFLNCGLLIAGLISHFLFSFPYFYKLRKLLFAALKVLRIPQAAFRNNARVDGHAVYEDIYASNLFDILSAEHDACAYKFGVAHEAVPDFLSAIVSLWQLFLHYAPWHRRVFYRHVSLPIDGFFRGVFLYSLCAILQDRLSISMGLFEA